MSKVRRLFDQFQPSNYKLEITTDPDKLTFEGSVTIIGKKIGRPSQRLTFHQHNLKITDAEVTRHDKKGDQKPEIARVTIHKSYDEVRVHAKSILYGGSYTVTMHFTGVITRNMEGIYPCFYKHEGKDKKLIATQFESHYARNAFPCIDEPEAKATFDLTLITPAGETVLANTPIKESSAISTQKSVPAKQKTTFETTPKMSTYLLAFVHGEMHCATGKSKNGVIVNSWATVAQPISHLEYANKEAIDCLDFFEDYFDVPFPLKNLDPAALPYFEPLAMQNWGFITYRQNGLLPIP